MLLINKVKYRAKLLVKYILENITITKNISAKEPRLYKRVE